MKIIVPILSILSIVSSSLFNLSPDPKSCSSFKVHYLDTVETTSCLAGLHFSPTKLSCMSPEEAKCEQKYWCSGASTQPYLADPENCNAYYECVNGLPVKKYCEYGLWWDVEINQCIHKTSAKCYGRVLRPNDHEDQDKIEPTAPLPKDLYKNPNMAICNRKKDLFHDGIYLKSVCLTEGEFNYETARQRCATHNMNLFIVDDEIVMRKLYDAIRDLVSDHPDGTVWINGKRTSYSENWQVINSDGSIRGPIYGGVDFYSKYAIGNCLSLSGRYIGRYQALSFSCTDRYWTICEHHKKTESPPQLDTSLCHYKRDLHYKNKYIKSMCIIAQTLKYDSARRKCQSLGMNLFIFDNGYVEKSFYESFEEILKNHSAGKYWINGKRDCSNNIWYVYNSNDTIKGLLYHDIEWLNKGMCGKTNGNCLSFSGENSIYKVHGSNCDEEPWAICEYQK